MIMTVEFARECFSYDRGTGEIRWNIRPQEHFPTMSGWRKFNTRYGGKIAGFVGDRGYVRINIGGSAVAAHRVAWLLVHGVEPMGEVDHINGDRADNRIENLRVVTQWANSKNRKKPAHNTSGRIGVHFRSDLGRWAAVIGVGGQKSKALGFFDTKAEAIAARIGAEKVLQYHPNHGR